MKPYESWEFCRSIGCAWVQFPENEARKNSFCIDCDAYKFHQYLRDNKQILEAGSELAKVVAEAERLREENAELQFTADKYFLLVEALKELPEILPIVLAKTESEDFKVRFSKAVLEG